MNTKNIKIIALLLVIIQCFTIAPITVNAEGEEDIAPASVTPSIDLTPVIPSPNSSINIPIRANFDDTGIESYTFTATGLTASEVTPGSMDYDLTLTDEFGTFELTAIDTDGTEHVSYVYTYKHDGIGYASTISQDQAWFECHKARHDAELITDEEFQEIYNLFTRQYLFEDDPSDTPNNTISPTTTTVKGKIQWEKDEALTKRRACGCQG